MSALTKLMSLACVELYILLGIVANCSGIFTGRINTNSLAHLPDQNQCHNNYMLSYFTTIITLLGTSVLISLTISQGANYALAVQQ